MNSNLKKLIENSKKRIENLQQNTSSRKFIILPDDFINLLNSGVSAAFLNEEYSEGNVTRYRHYAIYEGTVIQSDTEYKISNE